MIGLSMMLNTFWCPQQESNLQPTDYKSIALPAELQGHLISCDVFSIKDQISQYKIKSLSCSHASHARSLVAKCRSIVTNLSAYESVWNPISSGISKCCLTSLKQIKKWSGKHYEKIYQIYKTKS
tara:strand:- start:2075 stop:2449 length:375 start_codon:yes stop_codon:yes gene_type:complete